jgi:hypothetical protein
MLTQAVGKRVHGVVEVINGVGEVLARVRVRMQAGTRRAPVGIRVVERGVAHPLGTFDSFTVITSALY